MLLLFTLRVYAACRFYEAKLDSPTSMTTDATLAALKATEQVSRKQRSRKIEWIKFWFTYSWRDIQKSWSEIIPKLQAESRVQLPEGVANNVTPAFSYASKSINRFCRARNPELSVTSCQTGREVKRHQLREQG